MLKESDLGIHSGRAYASDGKIYNITNILDACTRTPLSFYRRYGVSPVGLLVELNMLETLSYGSAGQWKDIAGHQRHAVNNVAANQPTIQNEGTPATIPTRYFSRGDEMIVDGSFDVCDVNAWALTGSVVCAGGELAQSSAGPSTATQLAVEMVTPPVAGQTYEITVVGTRTANSVTVTLGGATAADAVIGSANPTGTTVHITTNDTTGLVLNFAAAFRGTITSISVKPSSNLRIEDSTALSGLTAMTIEVWVRPELSTNGGAMVYKQGSTGEGENVEYEFFYGGNTLGSASFWLFDVSAGDNVSIGRTGTFSPALSAGVFYHLVGTWDGATTGDGHVKIYQDLLQIDDTDDGAGTFVNLDACAVPVTIGSGLNPTFSDAMKGSISIVRIWNRVLTAAEIALLYNTDKVAFQK